ncbi:hypothetical protein CEXT_529101 [Caerostris extrusa]|uniref:Uncharacterized protein n=1 Tax=Caerostris extrusa TaxID=172846 RepID=A0AAV4PH20_CAEEX|nr:hypothetical protein CEXT_529101 [Caerostris extrusa]
MLTIELSRLVYTQLNLKIVDEAEFHSTSNSIYSREILTLVSKRSHSYIVPSSWTFYSSQFFIMKFLVVLLFAVLAVAAAQRRVRLVYPRFPLYAAQDETYAASLGVPRWGPTGRVGGGGGLGGSLGYDVAGASLGGAPVGIYGRQSGGRPSLLG